MLTFLMLVLACNLAHSQIFKKLGKRVKDDAEWRIRNKADQQVSRALDTLIDVPRKIAARKKANKESAGELGAEEQEKTTASAKSKEPKTSGSTNATAEDPNDMEPKDGYVTLSLSATSVFPGGTLSISGESVKYKNFTAVEITVSGPSVKDVRSIPLNGEGKYATGWYASDKAGEYTVTARGSDKKGLQSARFTVYELPRLDNWCDENIEVTNKAYDKLEESVENVKEGIGSKDKADLEKKLGDIKEKKDALVKLFKDLNTAGKEIARLAKSGKNLSPNLAGNLSNLNNILAEQRRKMKLLEEYDAHRPTDNTICEYLVMVNEACAAFSVYTNIESKLLLTTMKSIAIDKGVPKATGMINEKYKGLSEPNDFAVKEPAKIFATAIGDAESLTTKLGAASFAGDMVQFATDFLLKKYCGVYKGSFKHDYTIEFRNSKGENWWTYGVDMKAVVSLRYPKDKNQGNIIKMKGNIEGNATKFSFFEDIEKEDGFQEGSKGKIEVIPIKAFTPLSVPFATSERDVMGFGAIARGLATPAYFNIPIDAEYDVDEDKIKIFVNEALIDFTIYVTNKLVFLLVGGDLLPYVKQMNFPIHQARLTINSVIRSHNEFEVKKDSKGNPSFEGSGSKHIGDKSATIETKLNFTISGKKE